LEIICPLFIHPFFMKFFLFRRNRLLMVVLLCWYKVVLEAHPTVLYTGLTSISPAASSTVIVSSSGGSFASPIGYTSLTNTGGAFAALNSATSGTGAVTILITADVTNETGNIALNASINWTSMTINPSGTRTISGAVAAGSPLIDFNGADNVTIDGLNTGTHTLTISNRTISNASGTSTMRFIGGATTNMVTNCTILGAFYGSASTNGGTIFFSTDAVTTSGNDNNTISNCTIGPAGFILPTKGIHADNKTASTMTANNSGITISNNNIYDFFGEDVSSAGIYVTTGNTDWTITNNKFYQTATRTHTVGKQHSAISIANTISGNNFTITGNTIGFSAADGTGKYTLVGLSGTAFAPIYLNLSSTGTASSVQNNTISGIAMSGEPKGTSVDGPIICIDIVAGLVNIGNIIGNTIGSASATGSITYTSSATTGSDISGIYVESGSSAMTISNNTIGGITVANTSTGDANIYGIRLSSTGTVICQNNTIGGTVANSLQSTSTDKIAFINGIYNNKAAVTLTGNTIRNLSISGGIGIKDAASLIGISSVANTANTISQNTMYNLSNNFVGATVVMGIYIGTGTANTVSRNNIHSLTAASMASALNGIYTFTGTTTYTNNIIRLGIEGTGTSITTGMTINGIYNEGGINSFYYNTVYVGGSNVTGSAASSAITDVGVATRVYQNNVFQNTRSNAGGGTGKHYAIRLASTTTLTINHNVYFANGTGSVLANFNGTDKMDITAWRTTTAQDANSINVAPIFLNATGDATAVNLHLLTGSGNNCGIKGAGTPVLATTIDYDGDTRDATYPSIGADEYGVKVAVTAISGTTPACTSTLLTATTSPITGLNYAWGNPTTAISGATSGTYTATVTGAYNVTITETSSGCTASAAANRAITINQKPAVAVTQVNDPCQVGAGSITVTITGGAPNYTIAACGTTISPSPTIGQYITVSNSPATVTASGGTATFSNLQGNATYKLTVTDNNGCIGQ
jgi:trimeric autotransporter adhesin